MGKTAKINLKNCKTQAQIKPEKIQNSWKFLSWMPKQKCKIPISFYKYYNTTINNIFIILINRFSNPTLAISININLHVTRYPECILFIYSCAEIYEWELIMLREHFNPEKTIPCGDSSIFLQKILLIVIRPVNILS